MKKPDIVPLPVKRPAPPPPVKEKTVQKEEPVKPEEKAEIPPVKWQTKISIPLPIRDPRRNTLGDTNVTEWPAIDITKAQEFCRKTLKNIPVTFDPLPPQRKGACGSPAPILLRSIGSNPVVTITPPARVNCKMAKALNTWLKVKAQPQAKKFLKAPINNIKNIASYSCRNRYSNPLKKISEHAFANALDIAGFQTTDGQKIIVLKNWGPVKRDYMAELRKQERRLKKAFETAQKAALAAKPESSPQNNIVKITASTKPVTSDQSKKASATSNAKNVEQSIKLPSYIPLPVQKQIFLNGPALDNTGKFLHKIHIGACGIFGTVLGPEANNAHRNHFHFDLAPRRRGPYCE